MFLTQILGDADGHSHFAEFDLWQTGNAARIQSAEQAVSYWQVAIRHPGDAIDWRPMATNQIVAVLSGQMDVTVSNGDVRRFCRGDMLFAGDLAGQGHKTRFVGLDPCMMVTIAMPSGLK